MTVITLCIFFILALFGVPIAYSLALGTIWNLLVAIDIPMYVMAHKMVTGIDSFVILAVPFYILAGALMETGGVAVRLVDLATVLVGWLRGGLAMVVVVVEYIFSGLSGSTVADVSAVGSMLIPSLKRAYTSAYGVAVVSAATAMGMLVPPCVNMVVAGGIANISVGALFFGGFLPAIVTSLLLMALIYMQARKYNWKSEGPLTFKKFITACGRGLAPLGMPFIIFGGILGGFVTATEAGIVAVVYALILGLAVYREIHIRVLYKIILDAAVTTGSLAILIGVASVFAWIMAAQKVPESILNGMISISNSPFVFMCLSALVFMTIGALLEGLPAIVILLPIMIPIVDKLHINPVHYINVIIASIGIGLMLPPVGVGMLIACSIAKIDVGTAIRPFLPFMLVLFLGLVIMIAFPSITLLLPRLAGLMH